MATTSITGSTATTMPTASSKSSLGSSIIGSLNAGSGLDTDGIITKLTAAQKASLEDPITTAQAKNSAQISEAATIAGNISAFSTSLNTLISGGTLATQPTTSNADVVGATATAGARLGALTASVTVSKLAQAQTLMSQPVATATSYARGTLTVTMTGGASVTVNAGTDFTDLDSLVKALNDKTTDIKASIVTDTAGRHLVLKGASGAAQGFSISASRDVAAFAYTPVDGDTANPNTSTGTRMQRLQVAQDAAFKIDGVNYTRATNIVDDAIAGVSLTLAGVGAATLGTKRPTAAISQAMNDFVEAYNALKGDLDASTMAATASSEAGPLRGNTIVRDMQRQLRSLTTTKLIASGSISTLAELGVRTAQDGTLSVDTATLSSMLADYPDDVEAMFNPAQSSNAIGVVITSKLGTVAAGRYTLSDLGLTGGTARGKIDGVAMTATGSSLAAPTGSAAAGLKIGIASGAPSSAVLTIDLGLGGALARIKDALTGTSGAITALQSRLKTQGRNLADRLVAAEAKVTVYNNRLVKQFSAMNTRVSAFKATQSYLTQQVDLWTKSTS